MNRFATLAASRLRPRVVTEVQDCSLERAVGRKFINFGGECFWSVVLKTGKPDVRVTLFEESRLERWQLHYVTGNDNVLVFVKAGLTTVIVTFVPFGPRIFLRASRTVILLVDSPSIL